LNIRYIYFQKHFAEFTGIELRKNLDSCFNYKKEKNGELID